MFQLEVVWSPCGGSCFIVTARNYRENQIDVLQSIYGSINSIPDWTELFSQSLKYKIVTQN